MSNTYYTINPTTGTVGEISAAMQAKYGAGITIHYEDATNIIFSCPAVSDKVIKITTPSTSWRVYYGTAWTSGIIITDSVIWSALPGSSSANAIDLVLGDNTIFILVKTSANYGTLVALFGKLTNDNYAVLSTIYYSNTNCFCFNTTTGAALAPRGFSNPFASSSGKLFTQPILLISSSGIIEQNTDGSIASFIDVKNVSEASNQYGRIGTNYMMSQTPANYNGGSMQTSIIATF